MGVVVDSGSSDQVGGYCSVPKGELILSLDWYSSGVV